MAGLEKSVELYSPTGNCNHLLAAFPITCQNPVLVYVDRMIIACAGLQSCWEYNAKEDSWSEVATAPFTHNWQPGVVYQGKVYVMDEASPQVLNSSTMTWSSWPSPPNKSGNAPWMVGWEDCIILLGGESNLRGVQIFNITEQTWTVMNSSQVPMDMEWSSSLTLYNENVFIVGSDSAPSFHSAAFYNPADNSWLKLEEAFINHDGTRLVQLGSKIFAIDGYYSDLIEEFLLETSTWREIDNELLIKRNGQHSVLALPARLFSHLPGGCQGVE
jgi:hypothetical protein